MATSARSADRLAPTMSRRHEAGSGSATGLLFTVLGEFVLPHGEVAWTSALIEVLRRMGVEEKASRQALMRMSADGWLRAERVGRRTRWHLTASAQRLLTEGTERIYGFTGAATEWDGQWLLVTARIPETDRPIRNQLRTRLSWAGLGNPSPGLWISAHTDRAPEVEQILRDAGVFDDARIFRATYCSGGDLASLVAQAWDLDAIEAGYQDFIQTFGAGRGGDPILSLIELVHHWRRFPGLDPALPASLVPTGWSGAKAAKLFRAGHARWSAKATAQWLALNDAEG